MGRECFFESYIEHPFVRFAQFVSAGLALWLVALSGHPFSAHIETILGEFLLSSAEDHVRRSNDVADRFRHLLIVLIHDEAMNEQVREWCTRLKSRGQQQRGQEPAIELIVPFAV